MLVEDWATKADGRHHSKSSLFIALNIQVSFRKTKEEGFRKFFVILSNQSEHVHFQEV